MTYYGKLRTADWPRRQYPPTVKPEVDPLTVLRWCKWGDHWTDAPAVRTYGCAEHPRATRTPHASRTCRTCHAVKPPSEFKQYRAPSGSYIYSRACVACTPTKDEIAARASERKAAILALAAKGYSMGIIADELGIPYSSVRSVLTRSKAA